MIDFEGFLAIATSAHRWVLSRVGWLFSFSAFAAVLVIGAIPLSPLGQVRIGGKDATPILTRWNWFAITLCTTIATGILFWGTAEPIMHFNGPPAFSGATIQSDSAATFSISTLFMHWAFTPYAMYTAPSLAFALAYYNLNGRYSLSAPLKFAFGRAARGTGASIIDALALLALIAGVAASLGAGMMTLAGGLNVIFGLPDGALARFFVTAAIVAAFVASSVTGVQRGIKILSDINIRLFFLFAIFVFFTAETRSILSLTTSGLIDYVSTFVPRSVLIFDPNDMGWRQDWTMFYFANWAAWAPITALFLGRIAVGYTVREFILFTMIFPSIFGMMWMGIFGGATISLDIASDGSLTTALKSGGPEAVMYALLQALPLTALTIAAFVFIVFISFVTAMDSNTHSIASVCLKTGQQETSVSTVQENNGSTLWIKIFWGALIGGVSWIMTATNGVDGVKMLSNLGGAPGLVILLGSLIALIRFAMMRPQGLNEAGNR